MYYKPELEIKYKKRLQAHKKYFNQFWSKHAYVYMHMSGNTTSVLDSISIRSPLV